MKRPLSFCKSYYFSGTEAFDYARPLRAMAQWVNRHPGVDVLAVGVYIDADDHIVSVTLTVEDAAQGD